MVNFRVHVTSSGLHVFGGKNAENNDELVSSAKNNNVFLHTDAPGSPFVNVGKNPSKNDLKEAAIFCAKFSSEWRNKKGDLVVNKFIRSDMSKSIFMKAGTWRVKKKENINVKASDIFKFEENLKNKKNKKENTA